MSEVGDWLRARVRSVRHLTYDIRLLEIQPPPEAYLPPSSGSHIRIAVEIDGRPDYRSYTLVGPCNDGIYRIAVKLQAESRGGSSQIGALEPGAPLLIQGPRNHFPLTYGRSDYLLIAGGIGITPIYSMALDLARKAARFRVLYTARSRDDAALAAELESVLGDRLTLLLSDRGDRIELDREIARLDPDAELYVCGPSRLLEAVRRAWQATGRPVENLRFETFGNSGAYASEAFAIRIPRIDRVVSVPANRTMLEALEAAGVDMISDCRRGECGLCTLDILEVEGIVDHRDVFFSEQQKSENRKLCTCVSRVVRGDIVLDTPDRSA